MPTLAVAAAFALTWWQPTLLHPRAVPALVTGLLLEFFVLHSAGFLNVLALGREKGWQQAAMITGVGLLCLALVAGFAAAVEDVWPLLAFAVLFVLRVVDGLGMRGDVESRRMALMASWAFGVAAYLFSLFLSLLAEVPVLGLPPGQAAAAGMDWLSVDPHRMLCAGALYFTLVGSFELVLGVRAPRQQAARGEGPRRAKA